MKIVLIDDEIQFLDIIEDLLKANNSIKEIIKIEDNTQLDQVNFDEVKCIVSDFIMPKKNGVEVFQHLYEKYDVNLPPYFIFTSNPDMAKTEVEQRNALVRKVFAKSDFDNLEKEILELINC